VFLEYKVNLTSFIKSKTVQVAFILSILWVVLDSGRYAVKSNVAQVNNTDSKQLASLTAPQLTSEFNNELQRVYKSYFVKPKPKVKPKSATPKKVVPKRPANQEGEQLVLFTKNHQLKLRAIITQQNQKYALIEVFDEKTKKKNVTKFINKSDIYGYKLNIIHNTKVDLNSLDSTRKVSLIMYQRNKK